MTNFHSNIINIYGEKGRVWLDEVPELVVTISSKLGLRDLNEITNLSYNYVLSGLQGDNPIVLKLGLDSEGLAREAFALKCFSGCGAVKVLAENEGMLLLERAVPGTSLRGVYDEAIQGCSGSPRDFVARDDEAIKIACGVMKKLHQANIAAHRHLLCLRIFIDPSIECIGFNAQFFCCLRYGLI